MGGNYERKDHLYNKAKAAGYRSRAAYKLIELDDKLGFLKPKCKVLDLGCFPGGWLQVAQSRVGASGTVIGVDINPVEPVSVLLGSGGGGAAVCPIIIQGDVTSEIVRTRLLSQMEGGADVILSDMSPKLTGIRFRDVAQSAELVAQAFEIARVLLRKGGVLVAKVFPGQETDQIFRSYRNDYNRLSRTKLKSTRKGSDELYFIGQGFVPPSHRSFDICNHV